MDFNRGLALKLTLMILSFFALSLSSEAQKSDYNSNWEKVAAFEAKGLTTSALKEVDAIYDLAKRDKNEAQIIKSLLYKNRLSRNITEDATKKMIDTMEQELLVASEPAKPILQSITAQLYLNYLDYNRYRLYSVSNTANFKKDDIATWSLNDFRDRISTLFEASLQNKQLQKISLEPYDAIIEKGNARHLRPTLFDLLAHRALAYFKSTENDVNRPAYSFEIDDPKAFAPAKEFINTSFKTRDTSSLHLKALNIYRELIRLHLNNVKALIDVDLDRLEFVNQYAVMPRKQSLYIDALKNIFENYKDESAAQAGYLWARQVRLSQETNEKKVYADAIKEAVQILERVIRLYPASQGAIEASNELNLIRHPALNVTTEKVNLRNQPFRALVSFTNVQEIYLRIVPVTKKQKETFRSAETPAKQFSFITGLKALREWKQPLPNPKDYVEHSAEIKIEGLPTGEYVLLASMDKGFSTGKNLMSANFIFVSNISYINNGKNYFVLERETGMPLPGADVKILRRTYNYNNRKYSYYQAGHVKSDKNGFFRVPGNISENLYSLQFDVSTADDRLYLDDDQRIFVYNPFQQNEGFKSQSDLDKAMATIYFFTDRSIYRPGQTVYYKGIGVTQGLKNRKSQLLQTAEPILIYLYNANGQKIDSASVKLNEYGSFNGKFEIPHNQLTGNYRISAKEFTRQSVTFSVEEYKRPKFFAEFEKAKETYKVNDTIRITGKAEAYAGNRIDGAQVVYRVTRLARFIYPWRLWGRGFPQIAPMQITHGETITDENGQFKIDFAAIPDLQIDPKTEPVFDYSVTADITDINGETRTATIVVPVGYKALDLQVAIVDKKTYLGNEWKGFSVSAKNLSGEPQNAEVDIRVFRLKEPERLLRERYWPAPDTSVMSKAEYIRNFPNDVYRNEDNPETWEKLKLVINRNDSVKGSATIEFTKPAESGWYVAEATSTDRCGNPVKDVKYFRILDARDKRLDFPAYLANGFAEKEHQPGDTATVYIATTTDVFLIQQKDTVTTSTSDTIPDVKFYTLKNQIKEFPFVVRDTERGGFGIMNFFIKNNRLYYTKDVVNVPWSNKQLDITFETWRDKTLPGAEETRTVKIAGKKGEKVAAEMLVSMYDASLDQFRPHSWSPMNLWPSYYSFSNWQGNQNFSSTGSERFEFRPAYKSVPAKIYDRIDYLDMMYALNEVIVTAYGGRPKRGVALQRMAVEEAAIADVAYTTSSIVADKQVVTPPEPQSVEPSQVDQPLRKNFNETAFFYPELKTDKDGNISFSFTMPEALTTWKLMAQAHTKDLATGYAEKSVITQKDLMVIPNAPRFFREGDKMEFSAKVVNMTDKELNVKTEFHLLNAATLLPVDSWFKNTTMQKSVTVAGSQSQSVTFSIEVPKGFNDMVVYRIVASTPEMSDGEEAYVPVVTNRMLVTETLPIEMKGTGTKSFVFDKLLKSGSSSTLTNHGLTVEYTPNPAWYALQALPYLNNYPYECTEQVFNRYFANALAMNIANSSPKLKAIFEKWKNHDTSALMSNLQKNQELKSVLLEETPWVMQAKNEEQQKKSIALLFDIVNMSNQLDGAIRIVKDRQSSNGGFVWFKNGPDDRYMTQYIVADIGHLKKLGAWPSRNNTDLTSMVQKAVPYLDARMNEDYQKLKKSKAKLDDNNLSAITAHYLYARSFFSEIQVSATAREAYNYYIGQAKKFWLKQGVYSQGLLALALHRSGDSQTASDIIRSLRENAIVSETLGMYWKVWDVRGWWWYQAPIESQALMIEAFTEIANDQKAVAELKTWLLKNKQTNNWRTTKATAEAVYALLLQGTDWLAEDKDVQIKLGNTVFDSRNERQQEGTGYFKRMIDGSVVKPEMGRISVTVSQPGVKTQNVSPSWGSVYWQYFEDLDKITFAETPLKLAKKLFVENNTDRGVVLTPLNDGDKLKVGDKIKVRIELRVDRDMEYIHMKDMRASAMEPVNVLSQYKWQGGLGYYESTKDVSTNFFFNYLPKGTYVFEYPMFVTHSGDFSNGITTIQSMYAPEFTAHSEGVRVKVE